MEIAKEKPIEQTYLKWRPTELSEKINISFKFEYSVKMPLDLE